MKEITDAAERAHIARIGISYNPGVIDAFSGSSTKGVSYGLHVIQHPLMLDDLKIQVSLLCPCSDEVRDMMNAYLRDTFGFKPAVVIVIPGKWVLVSPLAAEALRKEGVSVQHG